MSYSAELTVEDIQIIAACCAGALRRSLMQMPAKDSAPIMVAINKAVGNLQEGIMSTADVMLINVCIQKSVSLMREDTVMDRTQRDIFLNKAEAIQNKLAGVNRPRVRVN